MDGKVILFDSNDVKIGETYMRRARQLVRQQRAMWTDESQRAIKFAPGMENADDALSEKEELLMYKYKTEVITTSLKWINDSASPEDVDRLDNMINERAEDGWELVTHSYMANAFGSRSAILITFRKQK